MKVGQKMKNFSDQPNNGSAAGNEAMVTARIEILSHIKPGRGAKKKLGTTDLQYIFFYTQCLVNICSSQAMVKC